MKKYGYDRESGVLFSWDGDFAFEGKTSSAPHEAFIVGSRDRRLCEMAGCMFLSGAVKTSAIFWSDGEYHFGAFGLKDGAMLHPHHVSHFENFALPGMIVCLCGPICENPAKVSEFCAKLSTDRVYVCPLVDELAAFGALVTGLSRKVRPRRAPLCLPNSEPMDGKASEYDPKLNGDGYGVMASVVAHGVPVLNEMMTCPGISPFYGRVLSRGVLKPESVFLVRCDAIDGFFPSEKIAVKSYAATSVPVEVKNTDKFKKASGCELEKVRIAVATDYVPMLPSFMSFYKVMSQQDFVVSTDRAVMGSDGHFAVFRSNKAYRVESHRAR